MKVRPVKTAKNAPKRYKLVKMASCLVSDMAPRDFFVSTDMIQVFTDFRTYR